MAEICDTRVRNKTKDCNAIRNLPKISNIKFDVEIGFVAGSLRAK
jgi:hypothetical protein